ncbi:migration and invasion-inhibitory protein isoform X2 [Dasypus novemcinctus]|uniref:migration and invasion-inhibitory protein isoform X2 n=1 Tax=Dasypus novemcinctus TaxID=9361 RepID=UPI00265E96CD|nr:migration and invasion-inhibitory protein isoform X4 [Dasypus novemcinctus]
MVFSPSTTFRGGRAGWGNHSWAQGPGDSPRGKPDDTPEMVEAEDLEQLRQLNLELLRRLWVGQDAVRRSVTEASLESSLDSSSSPSTATPASQETASTAPRASCPQRECHVPAPLVAHREDSCDVAWPGRASSGVVSLPLPKCHPWESLHRLRPHSAPVTSSLNDPELSAGPDSLRPREAQAQGSILAPRESKMCKPESMFSKESAEAKNSWYLDYDWTAGSLDSSSRLASKPEAFFSKLQRFREANKEECVSSGPEWQLTDQQESSDVEGDHECVYCYRVSRRLFLVPADPGTPCRLCGTLRDQRGPKALAGPAQVSTACWAGTSSRQSRRSARPPGAWTSGPPSPPRLSTRSCQPPALPAWTWLVSSHLVSCWAATDFSKPQEPGGWPSTSAPLTCLLPILQNKTVLFWGPSPQVYGINAQGKKQDHSFRSRCLVLVIWEC